MMTMTLMLKETNDKKQPRRTRKERHARTACINRYNKEHSCASLVFRDVDFCGLVMIKLFCMGALKAVARMSMVSKVLYGVYISPRFTVELAPELVERVGEYAPLKDIVRYRHRGPCGARGIMGPEGGCCRCYGPVGLSGSNGMNVYKVTERPPSRDLFVRTKSLVARKQACGIDRRRSRDQTIRRVTKHRGARNK